MKSITFWLFPMDFSARLIQLRKAAGLTQQGLSDAINLHVNQIRRYEAGAAQPTLDTLIRLAKVLHVRLDELVFAEGDRGPGSDMALLFEAIDDFSEEEKQTVREVLAGLVLRHASRRWNTDTKATDKASSKT